jgi:nucleoside-diphosphate-sugar epimerase
VGPTGYIGKFVVKELIKQGYNVIAFSRENAGIKGKMGKSEISKVRVMATGSTWLYITCQKVSRITSSECSGISRG